MDDAHRWEQVRTEVRGSARLSQEEHCSPYNAAQTEEPCPYQDQFRPSRVRGTVEGEERSGAVCRAGSLVVKGSIKRDMRISRQPVLLVCASVLNDLELRPRTHT